MISADKDGWYRNFKDGVWTTRRFGRPATAPLLALVVGHSKEKGAQIIAVHEGDTVVSWKNKAYGKMGPQAWELGCYGPFSLDEAKTLKALLDMGDLGR